MRKIELMPRYEAETLANKMCQDCPECEYVVFGWQRKDSKKPVFQSPMAMTAQQVNNMRSQYKDVFAIKNPYHESSKIAESVNGEFKTLTDFINSGDFRTILVDDARGFDIHEWEKMMDDDDDSEMEITSENNPYKENIEMTEAASKKLYRYEGALLDMSLDKPFAYTKKPYYIQAYSPRQAILLIKKEIAKDIGVDVDDFHLTQLNLYEVSDDVQEEPARADFDTCPLCGRRLNDGGTCPVCDDGEEDYESLNESFDADEDSKDPEQSSAVEEGEDGELDFSGLPSNLPAGIRDRYIDWVNYIAHAVSTNGVNPGLQEGDINLAFNDPDHKLGLFKHALEKDLEMQLRKIFPGFRFYATFWKRPRWSISLNNNNLGYFVK